MSCVRDRVQDAARCQMGGIDVQGDAWQCGINGAGFLVEKKGRDQGQVFSGQGSEGNGGMGVPLGAGEGCEEGPVKELACDEGGLEVVEHAHQAGQWARGGQVCGGVIGGEGFNEGGVGEEWELLGEGGSLGWRGGGWDCWKGGGLGNSV